MIEPPPWGGEETGPIVPLASPASAPEQPTALEVMRAEDGDVEWAPPPGPPMEYEPTVRFTPPPPDWRAEEAERDRVRAAETQDKLEPNRDPYPARPAREKPARWPDATSG
jgi:hypothetical protein